MESVQHIKTYKYFDISEDDFDKFQDIFAINDTKNIEDVVDTVECSEETFDREYTDDELESIFMLHAEYVGLDVEMEKDKVSPTFDRRKAENELKKYVNCKDPKKRKPLTLKSAKVLIKVLEAFDSPEFANKY